MDPPHSRQLTVVGSEGNKKKWENCVHCCCKPSTWIQFIAWTHLIVCTLAIILTTLAMLVTGDWGYIIWVVAAQLFIPLALSLPILPGLLLFAAFTNTFPNIRWAVPRQMGRRDGGEFGLLIWMEVIVFAIFVLMALILLKGFKEKKPNYLMTWLCFAGSCILMVVVETTFFMVTGYFSDTPFGLIINSLIVLHLCLSILPLLWAMGSVQIVRRELIDKMKGDEDLEESVDDYLDLQLM